MHSLFIAIQHMGLLILVIEFLYVCRQKKSDLQFLLLMVIMATLVNFAGYLLELQATNKEMALQAVKVIYLGKPFISFATFLFVLKYYNIQLPKPCYVFLGTLHLTACALVMTCSKHFLFYSSIDYTQEGYFPHLVLGHSAFYNFYHMFIVLYIVVILTLGIRRYRSGVGEKEKKQIIYLSAISVVSGLGLVVYLSGVMKGYDTTIPAYLISTVLLLISLVRYDLLDTLSLVKDSIFDEFSEGLIVLNPDNRVIFANMQVRKLYPKILEGEDENVLHELEELCQYGEKLSREEKIYEVQEKDIVKDKVFYGKMFVVSDITETYHYTINLERQTIIADQANKAKSAFLARMSHEIRTPINAVLGMNEMILRESMETSIREYAMDVKTSATALLGIINDILDTSKIESGKMEIIPVEYELDSMLNDILPMIYAKVREKELDFGVYVQEDLPNGLVGDDIRIRQVLINLLTNGVKYTSEGMVTLSVSGQREEKKIKLHFRVEDTGIGIKEEDLPVLCESFQRIEEMRNREIEGTGLGMNIVASLLHMMGSSLQVESVYGEGSVFSFDLWQEIRNEEPVGNFEDRVSRAKKEYSFQSLFAAPGANILIVDDSNINRSVFRNLLKETRMQIDEAASGEEGIICVQKKHYDLIFMDNMMPGMDGTETLQYMKKMENNLCESTPVVMITANAVAGAREQYLAAGFDDYISKPVVPEKLERKLIELLPEELISEVVCQQENPVTAGNRLSEEKELPVLEEFDWEYATWHLKDREILWQTLRDLYYSLDRAYIELQELKKDTDTPEGMEQYRIRVHGLKSEVAVAGALLLSNLARMLEVAAQEEDRGRVDLLHPILLEEIHKHRERLAVFHQEEGEKKKPESKIILPILEKIQYNLREYNYDEADELMEELAGYGFEGNEKADYEMLKEQIFELETQQAEETLEKMLLNYRED